MEKIPAYMLVLFLFCKTIDSQISTFSNPVLDIATRDAVVLRNGGNYYLVYADNLVSELQILKSPFLTDFRNAEESVLARRPAGYISFYPNSFLEYQNELYLYFNMHNQDEPWQMFAIKALDAKNPMGFWSAPVCVLDHLTNNTAAHGIPVQISGQLYFVWVGSTNTNSKWSIYIAKMKNPTEVLEPTVLLREPVGDWECGFAAPSFLYNREKVYMVFTSCTPNTTIGTSLSTMSIELGMDPMIPSNWETVPNPVFEGSQEENVYDIRFSEFTESPDGTETWMLYTASSNISDINPTSRIRIEKVNWNKADGSPIFPVAKANGYQQEIPSCEPTKFFNPVSGGTNAPNAHRVGNNYFLVTPSGRDLFVSKTDKLYDFANAEKSEVLYTVPENITLGTGQIFELNGDAYLYFYIYNASHDWLYVLKAENKSNLLANWGAPTKLLDGVLDGLGFHPTILQQNNKHYIVYAHVNNGTWVIYIAPMLSPTEVAEPAILLRESKQIWECYGACVTYWPSIVYRKNVAYMFFAASHRSQIDTSLSYMSIEDGKDPLKVTNWYSAPTPVFTKNNAENVYNIVNPKFTSSPDGLEDWMLCAASNNSTHAGVGLNMRIQKIIWDDKTQHPLFPEALGLSHSFAIPSSFVYFSNPITDDTSVSPGVHRVGNFYYMVLPSESGTELELSKSGELEDFRNADKKTIFSVPDGFSISGSLRMHQLDGNLYIYFSMEAPNIMSKMFVIQAHDPSNPMGVWDAIPILLAPSWNYPAFQGTVLEHKESSYLVWVSLHATGFNSIFIAQMQNATHVVEPFNLIRHPMEIWECEGACSNEAPYFIYNEGTAYMVLSVGSACKGGNGLTYMSISKDEDPMNIINWNKAPGKVFSENRDENVLCPAHATFTVSPDQKETWMVYHASDSAHPDAVRTARIEKISWDSDTGEPIFPEPHGFYHQQVIPSRKYKS